MNSMNVSTRNQNRNQDGTGNRTQLLASFKRACGIKSRGGISQESKSVEERALLNPLILKKILGCLGNAEDLLSCRAVCSDWKFLANEILLKRRSLTIKLRYDETTGAYFKTTGDSYSFSNALSLRSEFDQFLPLLQNFPLKNLLRLIKSADAGEFPFPCRSFEMVAGDLEADDLSSFLHFYGEQIKKLGLIFCPYLKKRSQWMSMNSQRVFPKVITVRNLLCRQLPNLEELEMFNMKNYDFDYPSWQEIFAFHNLFEEIEFELESTETGTQKGATKMMMIAQLSKLQKLCCSIQSYHNFHSCYSENDDPPKSMILKNMLHSKSLEFSQIFDSSWWCKDCSKALISLNQVVKFKKLQFAVLGLDFIEEILEKCPSQLRFEQLDIDFDVDFRRQTLSLLMIHHSMETRRIRVLNSLFNIMANSSEIGTFVHIKQPIGLLSDADFGIPAMRNVSHLVLTEPDFENELDTPGLKVPFPFFPCGFTLSDSFPNLRSVSLFSWIGDFSLDLWGQNCQVLPTVQEFNLSMDYHSLNPPFSTSSPRPFANLAQIFPNLTKLEFYSISNFPAVANCLWKFKELEQLKIGLLVGIGASAPGHSNSSPNSNEMGAIDSAITGFTMETCQQLAAKESQEFLKRVKKAAKAKKANDEGKSAKCFGFLDRVSSRVESIHFESLRVNPSICHLPKLKKLTIEFIDEDSSRKESYFLISELSGFFAFRLMPQLKVCLAPSADNSENLQKMTDHLKKMKPFLE